MIDRYLEVKRVFTEALRRTGAARDEYLDRACLGDEGLRAEVGALLELDAGDDHRLDRDRPAWRQPVPARVGRYRVVGVLGEGGMGIVYDAEQENPRRRVALKVIRPGLLSPEAAARFAVEAEALGRLVHAGIAQVYDAGAAEVEWADGRRNESPYIAMERVAGAPITDAAASMKLSALDRCVLMSRVCDAVDHAHRRGVVHRDLKPGNIVVGEDAQPKVLDFGIARVLGVDRTPALATRTGQLIGTPAYMSPEQLGSTAPADERSDVYALGVILFELLTGRLPHDPAGKTLPALAREVLEGRTARLAEIDPHLRGDLETIVGTAMAVEPARRYPSAAALGEDLRRSLASVPILARPTSATYRFSRFVRRNRGLVAGIALAALVLVAGISATSWAAVWALGAEADARENATNEGEQRRAAERRLDFARAMARSLLALNERVTQRIGLASEREAMVLDAVAALAALDAEAGDDPELLSDLSAAYIALGDVQGGALEGDNTGDAAGALEAYERALHLRQRLAAAEPASRAVRRALAEAHERLGRCQYMTARPQQGIGSLRLAVQLRDVIAAEPGATAHDRLAALAAREGLVRALETAVRRDVGDDPIGALRIELEALDDQIAAAATRAPEERLLVARAMLASAHGLATVRPAPADALARLDEALAVLEPVEETPAAQRDLWEIHMTRGALLAATDGPAAALDAWDEAVANADRRLARDPANARAMIDGAIAAAAGARALAEHDAEQADQRYAAAIARLDPALNPGDRLALLRAGEFRAERARLLVDLGRPLEAAHTLVEAGRIMLQVGSMEACRRALAMFDRAELLFSQASDAATGPARVDLLEAARDALLGAIDTLDLIAERGMAQPRDGRVRFRVEARLVGLARSIEELEGAP